MSLDPLETAFCQYTAAHWESNDWERFGLETGTSEILDADPRLYRSLTFGDDDYLASICRVLPKALLAALDGNVSPKERIELLYDYAPDLLSWAFQNMKNRVLRLLLKHLCMQVRDIPLSWRVQVSTAVASDQNIAQLFSEALAAVEPAMKVGDPTTVHLAQKAYAPAKQAAEGVLSFPTDPATATATADINTGGTVSMNHLASRSAEKKEDMQIFLVHGRDLPSVREVQHFTWRVTGIMPISLADTPGQGNTIIEKFEREADRVAYAIVLLTPDDEGRLKPLPGATPNNPQDRARQNVVLELGYFFGKLGRQRVAVLNAGVEQPSDVHGLQYISFPGHDWKEELRREFAGAGLLK